MVGLKILDHGVEHTAIVDRKARKPGGHDAKPGAEDDGEYKDKYCGIVGA